MTPIPANEDLKPVGITVYRADGTTDQLTIDLPYLPDIYDLREVIKPLVDGEPDHFNVLFDGRRTDMFCDEFSQAKHLPRNDAATEIYRAAWLSQHPSDDPEGLPAIYGTAVLFSKRVWF